MPQITVCTLRGIESGVSIKTIYSRARGTNGCRGDTPLHDDHTVDEPGGGGRFQSICSLHEVAVSVLELLCPELVGFGEVYFRGWDDKGLATWRRSTQ